MKQLFLTSILLFCSFSISASQTSNDELATAIDKAIKLNWNKNLIAGGVVLVGNEKGEHLYLKSFGKKSINPTEEDNATNTIYDLASISKIYTATAIGILVSEEKLSYTDKVSKYVDQFEDGNKKSITIAQLLNHRSGLPPVNHLNDLDPSEYTIEEMWENIFDLNLWYTPNSRTRYSDIGYMILSKIVEKVSGISFANFVRKKILYPLSMDESFFYFLPYSFLLNRVAPTESEVPLGKPHDPRCRRVGGASGHAGVFASAADLGKLAQLFLNEGKVDDKEIISKDVYTKMTTPTGGSTIRGMGLNISSSYTKYLRGDHYPAGSSFGHSGYTGTSIWIDPGSNSYLIILTNRVHLGDTSASKRSLAWLRKAIANATGEHFYSEN